MRLTLPLLCLVLAAATPARAQIDTSVAGDLARLRQDLHLSSSQEAAWRRYAQGAAPDRQVEARRGATVELLPTLNTPRRVALIRAAMAEDAADFRRRGSAVLAFYEQLTPEQQRTFDRDTRPVPPPP